MNRIHFKAITLSVVLTVFSCVAFGDQGSCFLKDGYKVGVLLAGYVNIREQFTISDREFIGFDLTLIHAAALGKQIWLNSQISDRQNFLFPGVFMLIDINGKLKDDSILTASLFPED